MSIEGHLENLTINNEDDCPKSTSVYEELRHPPACEFVTVPDSFPTKEKYWEVLGTNARAEYYQVFKENTDPKNIKAKAQYTFTTKLAGKNLGMALSRDNANLTEFPGEGVRHQLLQIKEDVSGPGKPNNDPNDIYIATRGNDARHMIHVHPPLADRLGKQITHGKSGRNGEGVNLKVRFLGYVGTHKVLLETIERQPSPQAMPMILDPEFGGNTVQGDWREDVCPAEAGVNEGQRRAINGLVDALEIIHGPPGTGKSTTIAKIVKYRVPEGGKALITSSRNRAIDSICEKFEKENMICIVEGNVHRMGETAMRHTLEYQTLHHERVAAAREAIQEAKGEVDRLEARLQRPGLVFGRRPIKAELKGWQNKRLERIQTLIEVQETVEADLREKCRAYVCTIGSIGKLMSAHEGLRIHTVLIDEAGSTSEAHVSCALKLLPKNIVLIGDHLQLPPLVLGNDRTVHTKLVDRSLMERLVEAGSKTAMLTMQYRMHPEIATLVSGMSYKGALDTDLEVVKARKGTQVISWVDHIYPEQQDQKTKSWTNPEEAKRVLMEYKRQRAISKGKSFMIITFYKAQYNIIKDEFKDIEDSDLRIVTVDGSQGSEADIVILSCVRSNKTCDVGFLDDPRRINVALSRAREALVIVGSRMTLMGRSARSRRKQNVGSNMRRPSRPDVGVNGFTCGFNISKQSMWSLGGLQSSASGKNGSKCKPPSPHRVAGVSWKGWNGVMKYISLHAERGRLASQTNSNNPSHKALRKNLHKPPMPSLQRTLSNNGMGSRRTRG